MANHTPGFIKIVEDAKTRIRECSIIEVCERRAAGETLTLVDVREESEFAKGHIPGSIHLGKGVIERDIEGRIPDYGTELILYCGGGYRSALAADVLQQMGYRNVFSMAGGWKAWQDSGSPIEAD